MKTKTRNPIAKAVKLIHSRVEEDKKKHKEFQDRWDEMLNELADIDLSELDEEELK